MITLLTQLLTNSLFHVSPCGFKKSENTTFTSLWSVNEELFNHWLFVCFPGRDISSLLCRNDTPVFYLCSFPVWQETTELLGRQMMIPAKN